MPQEDADRPVPAGERRLAPLIALGLALFLGGHRVTDLSSGVEPDGHVLATLAGVLLRYAGALTVAVCSVRLALRVRGHLGGEAGAAAEHSASSGPRTVPALALVVVGLTLLAASELQVPLTLRQLNLGNYSGSPFPGALGSVAQVVLRTSAYLGPLLTAVGAYLLLRPLETAATARQPGPWADPVTDLDE